jgi:small-conductance mechanosensitive channel
MVVVPNSKIGKNQVVNYSYPDTRFRIETEVSIAYGSDLNQVRAVLKQAVRGVQGVLPDKPVDALLVELGDSALKFRVRWWIESFTDTNYIYDMVHDAIYEALNAAGIDSPFNTYDVNLRLSSEQIGKYVRELRDDQDNSLK